VAGWEAEREEIKDKHEVGVESSGTDNEEASELDLVAGWEAECEEIEDKHEVA
jgi:hypothetical protein